MSNDGANGHHARGVALLQKGRMSDAIAALERAVALAPHAAQFLANLAEAYRRVGAPGRGTECAQRALELDSGYCTAWLNLGCCRFDAKDYQGAFVAFERASSLAPDDARSVAFCGDALRELGQVREAIGCYERAIAKDAGLAHAHTNLGPLLLAVGRIEEAISCCRRAVSLAPGETEPLINLGRCLFELDQLDEAMDVYAAAREVAPDSAILAHNIGQVWQTCNDAVQATLWYDTALGLEPQRLDTRVQLAVLRTEHGVAAEAVADLRTLAADHPNSSDVHEALGRAWWEDGDATEAVASYRTAVDLQPQSARLRAQMGQVLASAGNVEAAVDAYRAALDVNPNCIAALYGLAISIGSKLDSASVARIHTLLRDERFRDGARAMLNNALAHYFDAIGDYAAAARHAGDANALQWRRKSRRGWQYRPEEYSLSIDWIIAHFTTEFFGHSRGWGLEDPAPVFVVGMPRSGTTLTEQILASHPQVLGVGERPFAMRGFNNCVQVESDGAWQMPEADGVREAANWHREQLAGLVRKAGCDPASVLRIADKMPDNFSLLGWLVTLFPQARIIHCRRDLRDVAVSCWFTQFLQIEWACRFEHIAARVRDYRRVMEHWREVLPVAMLEIDYEAMVAGQERESRRLIEFLGLDWDESCLAFHRSDRLVRTASVTQVRQPIYARSVARWRRYEAELGPLFTAIGPAAIA